MLAMAIANRNSVDTVVPMMLPISAKLSSPESAAAPNATTIDASTTTLEWPSEK
jgi:hypothetical protein